MLKRLRLWRYAGYYLSVLVLFAFVYSHWADSFSHTTLAYERSKRDKELEIAEEIVASIRNGVSAQYGSQTPPPDEWRIVPTSLRAAAGALRLGEDGGISLRIAATCKRAAPPASIEIFPALRLQPLANELSPSGRVLNQFFVITAEIPDLTRWGINRESLLRALCGAKAPTGGASIALSHPAILDLKMLENMQEGRAAPDWSATFWRMMYFSATTITTSGFGDVVPVSPRARLLVGVEAVLGVLIVGFFLNAVAKEMSGKS
jgi:hypothetical protein